MQNVAYHYGAKTFTKEIAKLFKLNVLHLHDESIKRSLLVFIKVSVEVIPGSVGLYKG